MSLGQRLKYAREAKKLTQAVLSQQCGWDGKGTRITNYEQDMREPSLSDIERMAGVLGINPRNLAFGPDEVISYSINEAPIARPGYVRLMRLNVAVSAGYGAEPSSPIEALQAVDVLESWARQILGSMRPERLRILNVTGDSMTPTIQPGDIVFVDPHVQTFEVEGIYVLAWNGRLLVKRLRAHRDGRLGIHSDNLVGYPAEFISGPELDSFRVQGKVIGWWTLRKA